jgi:hypothetical protein
MPSPPGTGGILRPLISYSSDELLSLLSRPARVATLLGPGSHKIPVIFESVDVALLMGKGLFQFGPNHQFVDVVRVEVLGIPWRKLVEA